MTFNFHVYHQIVLQVAENVAQNESFVLSKVTPASIWKVPHLTVPDTHWPAYVIIIVTDALVPNLPKTPSVPKMLSQLYL